MFGTEAEGSGRRASQVGAQVKGSKGIPRSVWWQRFTEQWSRQNSRVALNDVRCSDSSPGLWSWPRTQSQTSKGRTHRRRQVCVEDGPRRISSGQHMTDHQQATLLPSHIPCLTASPFTTFPAPIHLETYPPLQTSSMLWPPRRREKRMGCSLSPS